MSTTLQSTRLSLLSTPAEFSTLTPHSLADTTCVVFDVLRATTSMITALGRGATKILPVANLSEALLAHQRFPDAQLAGERGGIRIDGSQTGGVEFDFGNSPCEFASADLHGKSLIWTTTNGTRALRSTVGAKRAFASAFVNLSATAALVRRLRPSSLLLIGAGTYEEAAWEDTLAAGALAECLWDIYEDGSVSDSVTMARRLFQLGVPNLEAALGQGRNGRRLQTLPELASDIRFAARKDAWPLIAELGTDGWLRPGSHASVTL